MSVLFLLLLFVLGKMLIFRPIILIFLLDLNLFYI